MADQSNTNDIKIITYRPEGQKREYSTYVEISANPREVSFKFCDLKPPGTKEELELIKKAGKVTVQVDREIVIPYDVAESLIGALNTQLSQAKNVIKKEKKYE